LKQKLNARVRVVRHRTWKITPPLRARCVVCGREVEALTTRQAGEILEVSDEELVSLLAAGEIHRMPTVSGSVWICKDSLFVN
jgi:hypothetical protein